LCFASAGNVEKNVCFYRFEKKMKKAMLNEQLFSFYAKKVAFF
jgi:hypothetical protein